MMLTFNEFKNGICKVCMACPNHKLDRLHSSFCYEAYKRNSILFINYSFQRLRSIAVWPVNILKEEQLFEDIFCKSGLCGKLEKQECKNLNECSNLFSAQKRTYTTEVLSKFTSLPFKTKINNPTIIFGGSKQWIKMVKNME